MPDTRRHRGPHPEDAHLFGAAQLPALRAAARDLAWLLDGGYALRSSLALVGDRHNLTQRQRLALQRALCSTAQRTRRLQHAVAPAALAGADLAIDGYNLLITLEAALAGGVLLVGRDTAIRDLASLHGTYRQVSETLPALKLIGDALSRFGIRHAHWLLDRPVSNSARLRELMLDLAAHNSWPWSVDLELSPDAPLSTTAAIVVTSDSIVLDRCARWTNLTRPLLAAHIPHATLLDLGDCDAPPPASISSP